jgi:hypothetical protein
MIFFMGMCHQLAHKHADDLSFELYDQGRKILVDGGKYSYNQNEWRKYFLSDAAHNTVGLWDSALSPNLVKPYGSALATPRIDANEIIFEGNVTKPRFAQHRTLRFVPRKSLQIHDKLTSDRTNVYASYLHFAQGIELRLEGRAIVGRLQNGSTIAISLSQSDAAVRLFKGSLEPRLGWISPSYHKMEPTHTAVAVAEGNTRALTWNIEFG